MKTDFELIKKLIIDWDMPDLTGLTFTQSQIDEIESIIKSHQSEMSAYFNSRVAPRLEPEKVVQEGIIHSPFDKMQSKL